jgi:nucleoid-associated protein YgaU/DNA-binding SARP family transcriptional activator
MRLYRQLLTGLGALTLAAGLVLGVPAALIVYVGWPLPTRLPTLEGIRLALRSGIDPQLLINTLAIIVWVVWAQLVVALTVEVAAVARGRAARRVPVLPGIQAAAAHLVATITLVAASLGPLRPHPAAVVPLSALIPEATHHTLLLDPDHAVSTEPDARPVKPHQPAGGQHTYRVQRFDTLWRIAETTLGDGQRWQEIRDLNLGRPTSDGQVITRATERIAPGSSLLLPPDAPLPTPAQDHASIEDDIPGEVNVERGDHLWAIAETALLQAWGRQPTSAEIGAYWRQVIDANRHRLGPPHDPNLIHPAQVFQLPPVPDDPDESESASRSNHNTTVAATEVVVERGDHLWAIAETALLQAWGRQPTSAELAPYWRQVIDANRHRLGPPHDPNLIYPGQTFQLPAIPDDPTGPALDDQLDVGTALPLANIDQDQQAEASPDPQPETPAAVSPPVTEPTTDETGATPPLTTAPAQPPQEPTTPPLQTSVRSDTEPVVEEQADPGDHQEDGSALLPIATTVAGLGVLAAGFVAVLNRLRRAQLRHRRPGTTPTPPPATAAGVEATLRAAAAPTATELIDLALRTLARQITTTHSPEPQVVGVHLSDDTLRLLLWAPQHEPPPGWQVDDDGRSWTLPTALDADQLRRLAHGTPAPYPALVTVGHGDRTQLLLDLEFAGALQVTGPPDDAAATCYTMATELAASRIADGLQVVCVGFGHDLAHLERIRVVDYLSDALGEIDDKVTAVAHQGGVSRLQGRLTEPGGDRWDPLIILDPSPTPPRDANRLLAAAHAGRAVCAVVGYPTGDRWRLHVADGTVRIDPLDYTFERRNLTPVEQAAVADLITAAKDLDGLPAPILSTPPATLPDTTPDLGTDTEDTEPAPGDVEPETIDTEPAATDTEPASPLQVRVLGTLRVDGLTAHFPQLKCPELVTYLVLHRHGVEADTLMEALWPEQPPDYRRLNLHTSRARTTLGHTPDGDLYLPHVTGGLYRVGPHLGCDLEAFNQHVQAADQAGPTEAIGHLQAALELVEGPPFSGAGTGYTWAHTEGLITHAIVAVDNAAHRLAQLALHADDPALASWAARKGLTATAACEDCYRNLMRAAVAEDDQTALEATFNELVAVVDADQGPDTTSLLHPDTVQFYEKHSRRRRHAG